MPRSARNASSGCTSRRSPGELSNKSAAKKYRLLLVSLGDDDSAGDDNDDDSAGDDNDDESAGDDNDDDSAGDGVSVRAFARRFS